MPSFDPDAHLAAIREKVAAGARMSFDDGVYLYDHADLFTLGELANTVRERKNGNFTYYNVNEHLNPTNVCVYRCTFCAFRADLKSPKGYVMTDEQVLERAAEADRRLRLCLRLTFPPFHGSSPGKSPAFAVKRT